MGVVGSGGSGSGGGSVWNMINNAYREMVGGGGGVGVSTTDMCTHVDEFVCFYVMYIIPNTKM